MIFLQGFNPCDVYGHVSFMFGLNIEDKSTAKTFAELNKNWTTLRECIRDARKQGYTISKEDVVWLVNAVSKI